MSVPNFFTASLAALLLAAASPARAQDYLDVVTIYRCVGADGIVAFGDKPCQPGQKQQQVRSQWRHHPQDPARPQELAQELPQRAIVMTPVTTTEAQITVAGAPGLVRDVATRPLTRRPNTR